MILVKTSQEPSSDARSSSKEDDQECSIASMLDQRKTSAALKVRAMKRTTVDPDSIAGRLQVYFEANPDEELSTHDICTKFGVTATAVNKALLGKRQFVGEFSNVEIVQVKRMRVWRYQR